MEYVISIDPYFLEFLKGFVRGGNTAVGRDGGRLDFEVAARPQLLYPGTGEWSELYMGK